MSDNQNQDLNEIADTIGGQNVNLGAVMAPKSDREYAEIKRLAVKRKSRHRNRKAKKES